MTELEVIVEHGRIVHQVSRTIFPPHPYGREDLEQVGMLALLRAYESFDSERGVPFEAYARVLVRARMIDAVRSWNPRWSRTVREEVADEVSFDDPHTRDLLSTYDDETAVALGELLARLSPRQRFCLVGRLSGLRNHEIGTQLGVNHSRVAQIISSIRVAA